jgi:hypothetical protein
LLAAHENNLRQVEALQSAAAVREAIDAEKHWWEELREWWASLAPLAQTALLIVVLWLGLLLAALVFLLIRPTSLLRTYNLPWDKLVDFKPAWLQFVATVVLSAMLLPWFAAHPRTRQAWIAGFRQGCHGLDELPRRFGAIYARDAAFRQAWIERYHTGGTGFDTLTAEMRGQGEVLDAWVERRLTDAWQLFDSEFFRQRQLYIPMPVWLGDAQTGSRLSDAPGPADFRRFFEQRRCVLSLIGDGGTAANRPWPASWRVGLLMMTRSVG